MATQNVRQQSMIASKWSGYQPTKSALAWSCILAAIAAVLLGFSWGGWVTAGTSRTMAATAVSAAVGKLATDVCIERFKALPDYAARLAELKAMPDNYKQRQYVESGGWATMPGETAPTRGAAEGCSRAIVA